MPQEHIIVGVCGCKRYGSHIAVHWQCTPHVVLATHNIKCGDCDQPFRRVWYPDRDLPPQKEERRMSDGTRILLFYLGFVTFTIGAFSLRQTMDFLEA